MVVLGGGEVAYERGTPEHAAVSVEIKVSRSLSQVKNAMVIQYTKKKKTFVWREASYAFVRIATKVALAKEIRAWTTHRATRASILLEPLMVNAKCPAADVSKALSCSRFKGFRTCFRIVL